MWRNRVRPFRALNFKMKATLRKWWNLAVDALAEDDKCPSCSKRFIRKTIKEEILSRRQAYAYVTRTRQRALLLDEHNQEKVRVEIQQLRHTYKCSACGHTWTIDSEKQVHEFIEQPMNYFASDNCVSCGQLNRVHVPGGPRTIDPPKWTRVRYNCPKCGTERIFAPSGYAARPDFPNDIPLADGTPEHN